ncbi:hypothetical protein [Sphingomonas sp.]|uniref:hypothetical protein n=1 Tax=Sphingomonas sp. TaxID=28214 RepID=UPI0025CE0B6B|nr:hypothetical protein [Sphingomonas sp.]
MAWTDTARRQHMRGGQRYPSDLRDGEGVDGLLRDKTRPPGIAPLETALVRIAHGDKTVRNANFENIDRILAAKSETHPAAARNLRTQLKRLFAFSILIKMRSDNPVDGVRLAIRKIGPDEEAGFHTWSEAEIEQYQTFHALGSKERLAMELMLWTGCRRGDVIRLGRQNIQNGRLSFTQRKTGKAMVIALPPNYEPRSTRCRRPT